MTWNLANFVGLVMRAPSPQPIFVGNLDGGHGAPSYVKSVTFFNESGEQ